MRILFVGGFYRGRLLAQRLLERGEEVVGAFVFEEDPHETTRHCEGIVAAFQQQGIWVRKTRKIAASDAQMIRNTLKPDVVFCLGWRTLFPAEILEAAPWGGVAVHDSLLPQLRGFAPTNWGIILGHQQLGATLFQLTNEVDAGDIYFQGAITPAPQETYESIQERIARLSVELFDSYLDAARDGGPAGRPQDHTQATYACARGPADGEIDWTASSCQIERVVRALSAPAPGAFTFYRGTQLVIEAAHQIETPARYEGRIAGKVIHRDPTSGTVDVLCGEGVLRLSRVRTAAGETLPAAKVVRSVRESLGLNATQEILALRERIEQLEAKFGEAELGIASATVNANHAPPAA
jgi:methionyl-tRNA formyltransferase